MSPRAAFVYDDAMSRHELRRDHPMRPVRLRYTYELLQSYGAFDENNSVLVPPRAATEEELRKLHGAEYISAVRSFSMGLSGYNPMRFNFSNQGDNPMYRGMYEAAALSTGASLVAAEMVADGEVDVAFNISGGTTPRVGQPCVRILRVQRSCGRDQAPAGKRIEGGLPGYRRTPW